MAGTIKKVHYGKGCANYEWRQKYSCGCTKDVQISASGKKAYNRALAERKRLNGVMCGECKIANIIRETNGR